MQKRTIASIQHDLERIRRLLIIGFTKVSDSESNESIIMRTARNELDGLSSFIEEVTGGDC